MESIQFFLASFFGAIVVHQVTRNLMGKTADSYASTIVLLCTLTAWFLFHDVLVAGVAFIASLAGHILSVVISRKLSKSTKAEI